MRIPYGGVAFFDSGIGGITVFAECRKRIKDEIFYYYGDNVHAPYGNRSAEEIYSYVDAAFARFRRLRVKGVVLACNTATAVCVERLRAKYDFPIIGTEPAVLPAAKLGGEVLVLATKATTQSERFQGLCRLATLRYPNARLSIVACPDLAGAIENNILTGRHDFSQYLPAASPNAIVLGCTHYIYIKDVVARHYNCPVFDGNEGIAKRLAFTLRQAKKDDFSINGRDGQPLVTTARPPQNCFLGSEKKRNLLVFEHMFAK
ncbi:MAG: glutamate racemase [Clostridiales bacterium]|nr:glutamate racemase [Clostridiales bacterium]